MKQYKKTFASFLFILISFVCSAQGPFDPPPPPQPPGPPGTPIDGGILVLLILGILYGAFVAYKKTRKLA
ncbi:hypothetical protein [Lacinutrix sp. 5H-3-7-4]|uniref:hypothetical protein n=1 Tax=Lacinutrix sp. (strain 5H-3-7-4) TaxID=983544 RepID=UPI00020A3716|nr:hypothetical protein [Lacinutrix sp. 5H-3-7-4]AEH00817.1 hypothetical protein Lacal_0969 [Lacinutrix sp. 5H-3-7-4]